MPGTFCGHRQWRNKALRYHELLMEACRTLERYPKLMSPELRAWWEAQRASPWKPTETQIDAAAVARLLAENSDLADEGIWERNENS